jgi:hypothetical protein
MANAQHKTAAVAAAGQKWESTLDPIGGGRKPPSRFATNKSSNKKQTKCVDHRRKPSGHKDANSALTEDHVYGVSPVYIALLAGKNVNIGSVLSSCAK